MRDLRRLLEGAAGFLPPGRVAIYGAGRADLAAEALRTGAEVLLMEESLSAARALGEACRAGVKAVDGIPEECGLLDAVLMRLPRGRLARDLRLREAWDRLADGGRLLLYGRNTEGIKSAAGAVAEVFGGVEVLRIAAGGRILAGVKDPSHVPPALRTRQRDPEPAEDGFFRYLASVGGLTFPVASRPGVFSFDALDPGTRLLLRHLDVGPEDAVLDLGCGTGVVATYVGLTHPECSLTLCDDLVAAVRSAERTLEWNSVPGEVLLSDGPPGGRAYDRILLNAPVHRGGVSEHATAARLIRECRDLLSPAGTMDVVAVRGFRVENSLRAAFGEARLLAEEAGYHLWRAARPL